MARSSSRSPELALAAVVEAEQLVGVAMLLVIVDETGIRRRGEDTRKAPLQPNVPRVAVQDLCVARTISHTAGTASGGPGCRGDSGRGTCRLPEPAGMCVDACDTSRALAEEPSGTRGRSAWSAAQSGQLAPGRHEGRPRARTARGRTGSATARQRREARTTPARTRPRDGATCRVAIARRERRSREETRHSERLSRASGDN